MQFLTCFFNHFAKAVVTEEIAIGANLVVVVAGGVVVDAVVP